MPLAIQLLFAIGQLLLGVGTLIVAIVVYRITKRASRIEAHKSVKEAFNTLNEIALSDQENLKIFDALEFPEYSEQSIDEKRMRWVGALMLNALESTFVGRREEILDHKYATSTLEALVPMVVRHDLLFDLLSRSGNDPEFAEYCRSVRAKQKA